MSLVKWCCTMGIYSYKHRHVHCEEIAICNPAINWPTIYYTNEYSGNLTIFPFFLGLHRILFDYYASPCREIPGILLFLRESSWKKSGRKLCIATLIDQNIFQPSSGKHLHVIDVVNLGTLNWPIYKEENKRPWKTDCGVLSPKCDIYIIWHCSPQSPGILMEKEAGREQSQRWQMTLRKQCFLDTQDSWTCELTSVVVASTQPAETQAR